MFATLQMSTASEERRSRLILIDAVFQLHGEPPLTYGQTAFYLM